MKEYTKIYDYDNGEVLAYTGENNRVVYHFNEFTIDENGELVPVGPRMLTRDEIRKRDGGKQLMREIDADETEEEEDDDEPPRKETPQERYDKKNTTGVFLKLNKSTDADILAKLAEVDNRQGYIKALIRADLKK